MTRRSLTVREIALWTSTPCPMMITDPALAPHHHGYLNDRLLLPVCCLTYTHLPSLMQS